MVVAEKSAENGAENFPWKSKILETSLYITELYKEHFPTDRFTSNFQVPIIGFVLSLCTFDVTDRILIRNYGILSKGFFSFAVFSLAVSYGLHYGLKIGDRKQYSTWILLKIVEMLLNFAVIIVGCTDRRLKYEFQYYGGYIAYAFIIFFLNAGITFIVIRRSVNQFLSPKPGNHPPDDEIIYDDV